MSNEIEEYLASRSKIDGEELPDLEKVSTLDDFNNWFSKSDIKFGLTEFQSFSTSIMSPRTSMQTCHENRRCNAGADLRWAHQVMKDESLLEGELAVDPSYGGVARCGERHGNNGTWDPKGTGERDTCRVEDHICFRGADERVLRGSQEW
ncbi:MAG: hypothetical protein Q9194_005630 [Teloschistes cf. exilis]